MNTRMLGLLASAFLMSATEAAALDNAQNFYGGKGPGLLVAPKETVPYAPSPVNIVGKTAGSLSLEWWDRSSVEDSYFVQRRKLGESWVTVGWLGAQHGWNVPYPYVMSGLSADTYYCLRAVPYSDTYGAPSLVPEACAYTNRLTPPGGLIRRLRVLTHNVFGFDDPDGLFDTPLFGLHCEARYGSLGSAVAIAAPAYDIVGLQEYWTHVPDITCNPAHLEAAITSNGQYTQPASSALFQPAPDIFQKEVGGGLGVFTLHSIAEWEGTQFDDTGESGDWWPQGFLFARIGIPGTAIVVDTYVVHTYATVKDACDAACHRAELRQLAARIVERSGSSGNPVLVIGDLNISGPAGGATPLDCHDPANHDSDDYQYHCVLMTELHAPRDLWSENHPDAPGHPGVSGATKPGNGTRLDYVLVPTHPLLTNSPYEIFVRNRDDVKVVKWGTGWGPVSDHYGVEATIDIRKRDVFAPSTLSNVVR